MSCVSGEVHLDLRDALGRYQEIKLEQERLRELVKEAEEAAAEAGGRNPDEKLGLVYKAQLIPVKSELEINDKLINLLPGMTVIAEVKTGQRRVIEFFCRLCFGISRKASVSDRCAMNLLK